MNIKINKTMFNEQFLELYNKDTPTQLIFGSASSGKSYSIMHFAVLWALEGRNVIIARKQQNQIRRSVFSEIKKAITNLKLNDYFKINLTDMNILSRVGFGSIVFVGVDDVDKLRSMTTPTGGSFDTVIMEEASDFTEQDVDQLVTRCRGISKFKKKLLMVFNPVSKLRMKWQWDRYFEGVWNDETDERYETDDLFICRYNYTGNKFLSSDEIYRLEDLRIRNPKFFRVYGLGKFGITGKKIFDNNYRYEDFNINEMKSMRHLQIMFGGDFGFIHKNALVMSLYDSARHKIYVFGEIGVREKTKVEFARIIKDKLSTMEVYNPLIRFDSAEPASIREMANQGLRVTQANKGQDSLRRGIDFINSNEIIIHPTCTQLFEELESLSYKKDSNGSYTEDVDDSTGDDLIASLRYAYSHIFMGTGGFQQSAVQY